MAIMRRDYGAARNRLLKEVAAYRETLPDEDPHVLVAQTFLVDALERTGKPDEAIEHCLAIGRARPQQPNKNYLPVFRALPTYPEEARRRKKKGHVVVALTVTRDGRTRNIKEVKAEPAHVFDRAAIDAAKRFPYAPRIENGEPVEAPNVRYIFVFQPHSTFSSSI